jgi:hypothetical protein
MKMEMQLLMTLDAEQPGPPAPPPITGMYLHQAAPDSPHIRGHRWKHGRWYLLAAAPAGGVQVLTGPHITPEQAWKHAPQLGKAA